jgi:CheY-like chemotaxis protein
MVLLDTSLHDTSGVKLLAELRQAYTPLQLPIIIITSRPSEASIVQALEAGANDVSKSETAACPNPSEMAEAVGPWSGVVLHLSAALL